MTDKQEPIRLASGKPSTDKTMQMGKCIGCQVILDYPGIKMPISAPSINRDWNPQTQGGAGYITKYAFYCHRCVHDMTKPDGEFEQILASNGLTPKLIWITEEYEDDATGKIGTRLQIGENTPENESKLYRGPEPDVPQA